MHRLVSLALLLASVCVPVAARSQESRVLVFSKTAGFRHSSIGVGLAAIRKLGQENGFSVDATEDAGAFTSKNLARYRAVVFLNTTGDVLDAAQQDDFERYIQAGGGYVGIHSAADTEYDWPWYGRLAGAWFSSHPNNPNVRKGTFRVLDKTHPSTKGLPDRWDREDEFYNFKSIDPTIHVVPGGQRDIAGKPPGYVPRRAPPRRCSRAAHHDGAGDASPSGRTHESAGRHNV